jgi:transketolase
VRNAFIDSLCEVAAADPRVWLLTGDLGYSVLERFQAAYPARYLNVGVAEQNMAGIAAGLARCGKIVFVYSIANFPTFRCLEQIRNDICHHELPVKVVSVGGGMSYGTAGYSHHGVEDFAIMRALPGMTVVAPADPVEARLATRAIAAHPGPCYLRLEKAGDPIVHAAVPDFQLGRAIVIRPGRDLTMISTGGMLKHVLETADMLKDEAIDVGVLAMHTVKPIDAEAVLAAAAASGGIVTVEEHSVTGGLGSAVADVLAQCDGRRPRFRKFGIPDKVYREIGSQAFLRRMCGNLADLARSLVGSDA